MSVCVYFCVVGVEAEDGVTMVIRELSGWGVHQPSVRRDSPATRAVSCGQSAEDRAVDWILLSLEPPHEAPGNNIYTHEPCMRPQVTS